MSLSGISPTSQLIRMTMRVLLFSDAVLGGATIVTYRPPKYTERKGKGEFRAGE